MQQVNIWQLNGGAPPYNGNSSEYEISINPYQTNTLFSYFMNNIKPRDDGGYYLVDIFQTPSDQRHIGFTSDPHSKNIDFNTSYSDHEFLTIGLHHEFYHGMQYTFNHGILSDQKYLWLVEGQSRAIQTLVSNPPIEFKGALYGSYSQDANYYIENNLNISLLDITDPSNPYGNCLFWRFLYENYNPTTVIKDKLAIFRATCTYFTAATLPAIESHMNSKLITTYTGSSYKSMDAAIKEFAKRVLFNDPEFSFWNPLPNSTYYQTPHYAYLSYDNKAISTEGAIPSSFGIDYIRITFKNTGKTFLNFNGDPDCDGHSPDFYLNLVLVDGTTLTENVIPLTSGIATVDIDITIPNTIAYLIIARLDCNETTDLNGPYGIIVGPSVPAGILDADFTKIEHKSSNPITVNSSVNFQDLSQSGSTPITSWHWDFPGSVQLSSTDLNPSGIQYNEVGVYPVSLTVKCDNGEQDTKTIIDYITVYQPGGPSGGTCEISGQNPSYGNRGQDINFNLYINSGTPPFHIFVEHGVYNEPAYHEGPVWDFSYSHFYRYQNDGMYTVTYTVLSDGDICEDTQTIVIGQPGTHEAKFNYTWGPNYPNTLGTNTEVTFHDATTNGYKPYVSWEWEYGKGINSGQLPLNTEAPGYSWETRWNNTKDDAFDGSPLYPVKFPAFDIYPVTLRVTDLAGCQSSITQYIKVSTATKCLTLQPNHLFPYNLKLKKHIVKFDNAGATLLFYDPYFNYYFPWDLNEGNWPNYCSGEYPYINWGTYAYPVRYSSSLNVVTNSKFGISKDGNTYSESSEMPQWYIDNPAYPSYPSNEYNTLNWETNGVETYWEYWFYHYWDPPINYYPNYKEPYNIYYVFPNAGEYQLRFEAWNKIDNPVVSPGDSPNLSMYDYFDVPLYVVDCEAPVNVNQNIVAGNYDDHVACNFTFADQAPVLISNNAKISYQSCDFIILNPGFTSETGSNFSAIVTNLETDNDQFNFADLRLQEFLAENNLSSLQCYPNPNNGVFTIRSNDNLNFASVEIYTSVGQYCQSSYSVFNSSMLITINNPINGLYIVKLTTISGQIIYKKVMVMK
ncbi:MAG: PKD domain-containing protein [Bacteroidales bacterium]